MGSRSGSSDKSGESAVTTAVAFGKRHLRHLLSSYEQYCNEAGMHLSLKEDAPILRDIQRAGRVLPLPILGGVHHQYVRV